MQDITDNAQIKRLIAAIEAGDFEEAFRAIGYSDAAMRPLVAAVEDAFEQGGVMTGSTFPRLLNTSNGRAVFRFDVRNSRAEAYLRDRSSTMVSEISDNVRNVVRTHMQQGMTDGRNPRNVALDIVGRVGAGGHRVGGVVGLTSQQEQWVRRTRSALVDLSPDYLNRKLRDKRFDGLVKRAIKEGKPLSSETVERLVLRYKDNALKYRGDTIARTEAIQALNASEYEAMKQAVDMGAVRNTNVKRIWDSAGDRRVRTSHAIMDGQKVGLDEPFLAPSGAKLMYPGDRSLEAPAEEIIQCRCRVRSAINWLAEAL
jgi:hypothetical protein